MWQESANDMLTTLLEKGWFSMVYIVTLGWLQFSMMAFIQAYGLHPVVTGVRWSSVVKLYSNGADLSREIALL